MGMFSFLGGSAAGAGLASLYYRFTTCNQLKTLAERLGDTPLEAQERAIKKIAILKALGHKDGDFSLVEQVFIYRYILTCPDLPTDAKVDLSLQLQEPLPGSLTSIWSKVRTVVKYTDLFRTDEEASGFVNTMLLLAKADGKLDKEEIAYIKSICSDCKIPFWLLPPDLNL